MINLTGFRVDDILHESEHIVVHQATHIKDNTSVVLKCAKRINLTPVKRIFFLKDYQLSKDIQAGCVIEPINFVESSESLIAVYPDTGCISLNQAVRKRLFQTDEILRLFYLAADALAKIHSKKWVHMNLTLDHILFDLKKLKVFLIDWKYAIQMKGHFITAPPFINRNSDIIPPELTGFTNDFVDERIDLYALGCIFYELFTNAPVFHEKNPLRQIQSHIMCQPVAPHEGYDPYMPVAQHVPESVSQILMQLLEKNPSKRYDNAHHLKCDLYKCLTDKSFISHIDPPGQLFPVIHATNKLYERDEAIDRIHVIYNSFSQQPFDDGLSTLLLISGKPGTGKTALCKTLIPHVFEKNGYWIYESCTNTPDFPLGLIGRILSQLLKMMHSRFSSELDNQIKQLTYKGLLCPEFLPELIPELTPLSNHLFPSTKSHSQIIDAKPFLLALFQMLGQKFQPMILCIEHVEWADDESIMILESLLSDTRQSFFVVATCHLNPSSSFQNLITHSQKRGVNVYSVDTCNLSELAVNQFMLDIFHFAAKDSEHFSKRIFDITEGNPRAVHMALDSMVSQKQIMIKKSDLIINDVSDSKSFLGHSSLYYLDHSEREILQKISCIGQSWSMSFACKITGLAELEMEAIILKAFKLGLIFPDRSFEKYDLRNNDNIWMFSDSGIHQRLYGDLSNDTKKEIHKTISQSMSMSTQAIHASLYMVARHLKRTNDLKVDHARIYLSAGERALMSGLFLTAYQFFDAGRSIFSEKDWQKHHQLLFDIHLNAMIAANFASLDDEISMIVEELSQNIFSDLEKLKYYECLAHIYFRQNQHEKVSETVRKGLSVVGQKLTIPTIQRQWTIVTTGLKYKQLQKKQKISDKDSKHRLIIRMMLLFIRSAYHWDPKNATGLIAKAIHRMLKNGITTDAPYLWILFARFLIDRTGFSKIALQWAHMGQSSLNQLNETDLQTETRLNYIWYVSHRSKSFHNHLAQIKEEIDRCLIRGYPDHAVQAAEYYLFLSLSCGKRLKNILSEIHDIRVHARMRLDNNDAHAMYLQTIHNLISGITPPHILTGQSFNEQKAIESWTSNNDTHRLLVLYTIKLMLCVLFKNHEKAVVLAHTCENLLDIALGTPMAQVINLYVVLAYSGAYHSAGHEEQKKWRKQINFHVRQLKKWSVQCPENAMHRYYLALAEETKNVDISNRDIPEYYDKAIALAKTNQFCHEEAFSNELAGTYYTKKERDKLAKTYIVDAYHAYSKWGADRKVAEYARQEKILDPNEIDQTSVWPTTIKNTQSKQVSSLSQVDNEDIWKVAQAFCVELKFDVLLENIIQTALRHSGAHKGCLVLKKRQAFFVEAHMNMETQEMGLMVSEPLETSHKICLPIAQQVIQSNTPVCLWDAGKQGEYQYDVYIRENAPRSLLCVPVAYHDNIAGLLYLENKRLTGLFTTDRVNRIQIIASQAAIAIKNAQFFHTQEKTVQNRATDLNLTVHQLSSAIQDLEARSREMMLLNQFSDALHGCQTDEASYLVLQSFAQKLFPGDIGILWIGDKNEMKTVTTWGAVTAVSDKLEKTACPCLQSKSLLFVEDVVSTPRCKSCGPANDHVYICIPLKDQSGEMGVLHFQFGTVPPQIFDDTFTRRLESRRMLICRMIAHYALALTNLRLREALKYESRHDPLTGLFNRRHMQNMLKEAYEKAKQYNQYLGIVMIDIDHFKSFNDTYGHDTGDSVLKHLGAYLQEKSCSTLHPCRYGGEEFLLMCPDLRPDELFQTAESVRKGIMNEIKVPYEDKLLDVTASLGTAVFPEHGDDMTQVIQNADQALYKSKESGRNQVQMSGF